MSVDYKLANIFGTVYTQGNLVFTPDGTCVLSPVGNRVSCFDVVNNKSFTFTYEHRKNVARIAINSKSTLMLSVDENGRGILVNFRLRTVLHHFNFKDPVAAVEFSPDGSHIAVASGRQIQMWRTPSVLDDRQFSPFVKRRTYTGHFSEVTSIQWSSDSRFFLTAAKDMTAHIYSLHSDDAEAASTLAGHRDAVVGAFFSQDQETIYTVSKDGAQFEWQYDEEVDRWVIVDKHFFMQNAKVRCADFHAASNLLVVGFSSGLFGLYELPSGNMIQSLSISQNNVDFVAINKTGEWLLFGASKLGQLLVWEWQSETYVLKQQSHFDALNALEYSPDGTKIVTGADDGKIKVWDAKSGFCIVTFTQHQAAVTSLVFSKRGNVLFSASLDGSVRAWDLLRYRNFRTLTAPKRLQFTSLAVDASGELVCAGSLNDFDIHIWNVQTSQLVDRLSGHEGPVSALDFSPDGSLLASGSWDHTARMWNFFGRTAVSEPIQLQTEVLDLQFSPDASNIAVSTMDGQISVWNVKSSDQVAIIDGRKDIVGGRHAADRFSSQNSARAKHFTNICFSSDGKMLLAGGNSKHVCLYDVANQVLLRKITISKNMALEGTLEMLISKKMTEAGSLDLIDTNGENSDLEDRIDDTLPGASRGDLSARRVRPEIRTSGIKFSPTSASFSTASTEGLLVYAIDTKVQFDPVDLDVDVTVDACIEALNRHEFLQALIMAFRLGESMLLDRVYLSIPIEDVPLVVRDLPQVYIKRLLVLLGEKGQENPHIEFNLCWLRYTLESHGRYIADNRADMAAALRDAQRFIIATKKVTTVAQENVYRANALQVTAALPAREQ
ncbi:Periodic tryptophan protein 2 [Wickerhamiella sorbophila]|uniref:Periodic tryptophan protein 2 n=1 Tax=Wickerhamiella sorbophila TaxID=45607 RepID=A0A2T0FF52_9ASCO|nr:Periodic tryptophan protein 2 [Wickerhamiella sorbophila]PRT53626.1 Periodic tryptophan protein 2 [Wickerhamiella sorbophila]